MKQRLGKHGAGFTLLELLIAMAVFAIMAAMAYGGLRAVMQTRLDTQNRARQLREVQQAFYWLNEDLQQAVARPVRDELGDSLTAFQGGMGEDVLSLTRSTPEWLPDSGGRSNLQRVVYRFRNGMLYRGVWNALDRTPQSRIVQRRILEARSLQLRFYGGDWSGYWPVAGAALPRAVEVNVELPGLGTLRRVFGLR
ncbi:MULTISPECIES: type II secretion system minor pseudopilin GspJ [Methylomonas]|uniref:type II secretion system minor pseudopilin GspJ n=1 Tax=Methylomonas TaxID=416 RepID=UPI001232D030|nr:type II secretion system minor pseudopilin GspJ [Methylomonas rhizoryzae]